MNSLFESGSSLSYIAATAILGVLAVLILVAVIALIVSVKRERAFANVALPDLDVGQNVDEEPEEESPVSVFTVEDNDDLSMEDQDSNRLMEDIAKARANVKVNEPQTRRGRRALLKKNK